MNIVIEKAETLPTQMQVLADSAAQDGFQFLHRLIEDYTNGKNRFTETGEFFLTAYDDEKLVACGGLNIQHSDNSEPSRIGRVRLFYVLPEYRKHGIGKQLLLKLESMAKPQFSALCLNTHTKQAEIFYQKQNYVYVENHSNYNYFKYLIQ